MSPVVCGWSEAGSNKQFAQKNLINRLGGRILPIISAVLSDGYRFECCKRGEKNYLYGELKNGIICQKISLLN